MLEEKRRRDEAKLRDVIAYAYAKDCRQRWILNYFGEKGAECCGKCDNCAAATGTSDVQTRELSPMELTVVRKALSGVARLSRRAGPRTWLPRFGRGMIVKSLLGSSDARIRQLGLDKISTHGILKAFGKKFVNSLFDALADAGLVETSLDGEYPLLGITDAGAGVLLDSETTVRNALPEYFPLPRSGESQKARGIAPLLRAERLRKAARQKGARRARFLRRQALRNHGERAHAPCRRAQGKAVPDFFKRHSRGIRAPPPRTLEEAALIKGVGEVKLRSTAPAFVRIIEGYGRITRRPARAGSPVAMPVAAVSAAAGMFAASIVAAAMEIGVGFELSGEIVLGALADVARSPAYNLYAKFRQAAIAPAPMPPHISTSIFLPPNKPASTPCPESPHENTSAP